MTHDYSKPPPGWTWYDKREEYVIDIGTGKPGLLTVSQAWAVHKRENDPPGMEVFSDDGSGSCWHYSLVNTNALNEQPHGSRDGARAAAWTWYDTNATEAT